MTQRESSLCVEVLLREAGEVLSLLLEAGPVKGIRQVQASGCESEPNECL